MAEPDDTAPEAQLPRAASKGVRMVEAIGLLITIAFLSTIVALPQTREEVVSSGGPAGGGNGAPTATGTAEGGTSPDGSAPSSGASGSDPASAAAGSSGVTSGRSDLECAAGRNGGETDVGVTADSIKLGATVVDSGIGSAFLSDVRWAMIAVANEVNAAGGICGRRLELILKDDGWEAERGFQFIRNLIEGEKVFALAVVPSSEGLRIASTQRYLRERGVPAVGTDGMLISQYTDPMIWPVAASTITGMHVMAKDAFDRGRRKFGIVYDSNFRFGVEGAFAFNESVKRLTGSDIPGYSDPLTAPRCRERFCGIKAGQPSYQTELQVFNSACQGSCDYVMYLLEPQTAQTWMEGGGLQAKEGIDVAGPQPLFNRSFGSTCGAKCHGMWVWTGFVPPIGRFANQPSVAEYTSDLEKTNKSADAENSFVLGGYLGMKLLVEALEQVGPDLTRARLIATLDSTTLDTGLSPPLRWTPDDHFANQCMMPYSIQSRPQFAGWRQQSDFVCDPWPGQDIPASER